MQDRFLEGRCVAVTGGLSGQGLAIADLLARHGAAVATGSLVGSGPEGHVDAAYYPAPAEVEAVARRLGAHGVPVHAGNLDVRSQTSIDRFMDAASGLTGSIDILVNSAGTTAEHPVIDHDDALWQLIIDVNLSGPFRMTRSCLPGMISKGWGRIIMIGSTAATVGWRDNPAYCSSKSGLLGLTRCVALEGASVGVTCNMNSPTWVETELMRRNIEQVAERCDREISASELAMSVAADNPQGRHIQPDEVAGMALYLCREDARGITGENIRITGGAHW